MTVEGSFKGIRPTFSKNDFGDDFIWGVATSAFQTEGAVQTDGKGLSIWDVFSAKKGNIFQNHSPLISCDFYHHYEEDIALMAKMNIKNFRFSISWPRVMPKGVGDVNQSGLDYYNKVIDSCLKHGIEPWITLYHWDLPQELELRGGWTNRDIIHWFETYVNVCTHAFGDRVKNWMVLNEPMAFTGIGYFLGIHAPGRKGLKNFIPSVHHATLCQGIGGRIIKSEVKNSHVGTTFSCSHVTPFRDCRKDNNAAKRVDALLNRMFIEPCLGLGYPIHDLPFLQRIEKFMTPDDEPLLSFDFDFIGLQNYTREVIKFSRFVPYIQAMHVKPEKRNVAVTTMNWEVYPEGIYRLLKKYHSYPQIKNIYITENGASYPDILQDGHVQDKERLNYLRLHMYHVLKAIQEGVPVKGYFVWSFTDNFEWAEGYMPRFGLVYIDYDTQKRIIKDSGNYFSKFLE